MHYFPNPQPRSASAQHQNASPQDHIRTADQVFWLEGIFMDVLIDASA